MAVVADGRPSTTGYRVRERFAGWTLLELDLVTGRTHQIRVHLEAIGHPIAGDPVYGTGTSRRGPDGLEPPVPACLAARARSAGRRAPHPGRGAPARRAGARARWAARAESAVPGLEGRRERGAPVAARRAGCRARTPSDAATATSRTTRAVRTASSRCARCAAVDHLGAVRASARTRSSTRCAARGRARPDGERHYVVTVTTRGPARRRGRRRRLPVRVAATSSSRIRAARGFLEANEVHGNWYGSPRDQVREALARRQATPSSRSTSRAPRSSRSR